MSGLVVRHMVKHYYKEIKDEGITINHIATIGTPNHGTTLAGIATAIDLGLIIITGDDICDLANLQETQRILSSDYNCDRADYYTGDFNGDGKTDLLAFYRYYNGKHTVFCWYGTGSGLSEIHKLWEE